MRIISIHVGMKVDQKEFIFLRKAYELGFVAFYKRSMAKKPIDFAARTCLQRIRPRETIKIKLEDVDNAWMFGHVNADKVGIGVICDDKYPDPAAKKVILGVLKVLHQKFSMGRGFFLLNLNFL
jgi:hypothetical protein